MGNKMNSMLQPSQPAYKAYDFQEISQQKWKIREMPFHSFAPSPFYSITFEIDLTEFNAYAKSARIPTYPGMLYIISKTANQIEQFRYRIKNGKIVCYDKIDAGITLLLKSTQIKFRRLNLNQRFTDFVQEYQGVKENNLEENIDLGEDVLYTSCLPWIPFTGFSCSRKDADFCIPTILWGKIVNYKVSVSVQVNHRVIDGYHLGELYKKLQENFKNAENMLK